MLYFIIFFLFLTVIFTVLSLIQKNILYSLFYLALSILTTSGIFFLLGDYFIGSLQIIIYAGSILVLFVFVIMVFNFDHIKNKNNIFTINYLHFLYLTIPFLLFIFNLYLGIHKKYIFINTIYLNNLGHHLFTSYVVIVEFVSLLLLASLLVVLLIAKHKKLFLYLEDTVNRINNL